MSRIGKMPVPVPSGVTVSIDGSTVSVKGPKGELSRKFPEGISFSLENNQVLAARSSDEAQQKAVHGLSRALVANMVEGVTKGYQKQLEITGVGYKAEPKPYGLLFSLGYSHTIEFKAPKGITLKATQPTQVLVEGADKEVVGQVAAEIRSLRKPEPYKGKGIKYVGEKVRRKAGKAGGK
ncbi:MAG TPA: 50S ribosomal protein L6 [Gemmatimonadaceae bacterium]|jgi:large subunit ribosomal protein L6|nr:50S ribosomal protein L6 [Gemmatimonadaceae bacterium]